MEAEAKARAAAVAAEVVRLNEEGRAAVERARSALRNAEEAKVKAETGLRAAKNDLTWAKANKKSSVDLARFKGRVDAANRAVDFADDAADAAREELKRAEKALRGVEAVAERNVDAALRKAESGKAN